MSDEKQAQSGANYLGISRRHLLMGAGLLAVSGVAMARMPTRKFPNLSTKAFDALIPRQFGDWKVVPASELVLPPEDELSKKLYEHILTRTYRNSDNQIVMFLVAYNSIQINDVQVHRPEVCYRVAGYKIDRNEPLNFALADGGRSIPSRFVLADSLNRNESIIYWTRVGTEFPQDWSGQRWAMMTSNLRGYLPDGVLVRASMVEPEETVVKTVIGSFMDELRRSAGPEARRIIFGDEAVTA